MTKLAIAISFILTFFVDMCSTETISSEASLQGEWVIKNVFLGDAIDTPCGYEVTNAPTLTINFSADKQENSDKLRFNGSSAVNSYFGGYKVLSYDSKTGIGTLEMGAIGSTKMAGPAELMQCEQRIFDFLQQAKDFEISTENGKTSLHLGIINRSETPSRDGGTYLILEKAATAK